MTSLGPSIVVLGDIEAHDDLVIEGRVKGHVRSERAAVTVSEGAMITGDIVARVIVVAGQVTGTLTASERVEIDETANVKARIIASAFVIRDGAVFTGEVHPQPQMPTPAIVRRHRDAAAGAPSPAAPAAPKR